MSKYKFLSVIGVIFCLFSSPAFAQHSTFYGYYPPASISHIGVVNMIYAGNETFYMAGERTDTNLLVIIKTNGNGVPVWEKGYKLDTAFGISKLLKMSNGDLVVIVYGMGGASIGFLRVDANGNFLQLKALNTIGVFTTFASAATNDGGFIIAGSGCPGNNPIVRIDASGNVSWAQVFNGTTKNISDIYSADGINFLLFSQNTIGNWGLASLTRIDKSGTAYSSPVYDFGSTSNVLLGGKMAVSQRDSSRFFWISGTQSVMNTDYLVCTDVTGHIYWAKTITLVDPVLYPGAGGTSSAAEVVTGTVDGGVVVAQTFSSPIDAAPRNLFTKFDSSGNVVWSYVETNMVTPHGWTTEGPPLCGIYLRHDSTIIYNASNPSNAVMYRIDETGHGLCVQTSYSVAVAPLPLSVSTVTPTAAPITVTATPHTCLWTEYIPCSITYYCEDTLGSVILPLHASNIDGAAIVNIYPNPATNEMTVTCSEKITNITVINLLGQTVHNQSCNSESIPVAIGDLPPGIYFVKINNVEVRKFVKR